MISITVLKMKLHPLLNPKDLRGKWDGIAENVGRKMARKILPGTTNKIIEGFHNNRLS